MKKSTTILALALFLFSNVNAVEPANDGTVSVNPEKSKIAWKGEKVTGEHSGTINIKSGSLMMKDGKLQGGEFIIDMTSIVNTDLEGEYKGKLEGHLKSDDFFGVENFPTATLKITSAKETSKTGVYNVNANLTIKGITNQITFTATMLDDKGIVVANANIIVDRSKYNVKYGSGSFFDNLGDKTIYDEFTLSVNLVTK